MDSLQSFLTTWDSYMLYLCYAMIGVGILIFLYYEFSAARVKDLKDKYDYINLHEIKYFWYTVFFSLSQHAPMALLSGPKKSPTAGWFFFWVRLFIVSAWALSRTSFLQFIEDLLPKYVEKRLDKLRNTPRTSPAGNKMRKLSEEEEDAYMDATWSRKKLTSTRLTMTYGWMRKPAIRRSKNITLTSMLTVARTAATTHCAWNVKK